MRRQQQRRWPGPLRSQPRGESASRRITTADSQSAADWFTYRSWTHSRIQRCGAPSAHDDMSPGPPPRHHDTKPVLPPIAGRGHAGSPVVAAVAPRRRELHRLPHALHRAQPHTGASHTPVCDCLAILKRPADLITACGRTVWQGRIPWSPQLLTGSECRLYVHQVTQRWVHFEGKGVPRHLARQLAALDALDRALTHQRETTSA